MDTSNHITQDYTSRFCNLVDIKESSELTPSTPEVAHYQSEQRQKLKVSPYTPCAHHLGCTTYLQPLAQLQSTLTMVLINPAVFTAKMKAEQYTR